MVASIVMALLLLPQAEVKDVREGDQFWRRAAVIPPHEFTEAAVVALAREFADDTFEHCKVALLYVVTDRSDFLSMSKPATEVTYDGWWRAYASMTHPHLPIAEAIAVRSGAVLRISDGTRQTRRVVLRGSDPLLIRAHELDAEVVHVRLFVGIPLASGRFDPRPGAEVFVRSRAPLTEANGEAISSKIAAEFGLSFAQVFIRNDVWFIDQTFFPLIYRFEESRPPSFNEYRATRYLECLSEGGETSCWPRQPRK